MADHRDNGTIRRRAWRRGLACVAGLALAATATACSDDGGDSAAAEGGGSGGGGGGYQVTAVSDLTGNVAQLAGPFTDGLTAYFDQLNEAGGIDGEEVEFTTVDTLGTADGAQAAFRRVLQERPAVVTGYTSVGMPIAEQLLASGELPLVSGITYDPLLEPDPAEWFYSGTLTAQQNVGALVSQLERELDGLDGKRVALAAASLTVLDAFADTFEALSEEYGFEVATIERPEAGLSDFTVGGAKIADADPDGVIFVIPAGDVQTVANGVRTAGYEGEIVAALGEGTDEVLAALQDDAYSGMRLTGSSDSGPLNDAADANGFSDLTANDYFRGGWAAAAVIAEALSTCGSGCQGAEFIEAIQQVEDFEVPGDALLAPVTITAEDHVIPSVAQFFVYDDETGAGAPADAPIDIEA